MELVRVIVDLDAIRKMDKLARRMKDEGVELMRGKTDMQRASGDRVWGLADTMDALIRNCILPHGLDNAEHVLPSPQSKGTDT